VRSFDHGVGDLVEKDNYVTPLYKFITYLHLLLRKKTYIWYTFYGLKRVITCCDLRVRSLKILPSFSLFMVSSWIVLDFFIVVNMYLKM
jgi:hypothetical protein